MGADKLVNVGIRKGFFVEDFSEFAELRRGGRRVLGKVVDSSNRQIVAT